MSAKLIFVRRSDEEINIFGGQVFADVDGKNVATIGRETITIDIPEGKHIIKMYKSHDYGSMIGFAETEITVSDEEKLVFKYSSPMVVTQPGHIVVSDFTSYEKLENDVKSAARVMAQEKKANDEKIKRQEEASNKNMWAWFWLIIIIPAVLWVLYEVLFWETYF